MPTSHIQDRCVLVSRQPAAQMMASGISPATEGGFGIVRAPTVGF